MEEKMNSPFAKPFSSCGLHSYFNFCKLWSQSAVLFLVLVAVLPVGCATSARITQFQQFADAANKYAAATIDLTNAAGIAVANADSVILVDSRDSMIPKGKLTPETNTELSEKLKTGLAEHNEDVLQYLDLMGKIRLHLKLLQDYFNALSALASSNAPSGIGTAAESAVAAMGTLSPQIKNAKIGNGNMSVSQFTGAVVPIVVARFQQAALENELRARAPILERELDVQQAALQAMVSYLESNQKVYLNYYLENEVFQPYIDAADKLPANWIGSREALLTKTLTPTAAASAAEAAKGLKLAFVALAEDRLDLVSVQSIIREANELLALAQKIQLPPTTTTSKK